MCSPMNSSIKVVLLILGLTAQMRSLTLNDACQPEFLNLKMSGKALSGPAENYLCSSDRGLVCIKNKCVCAKSLVWDSSVDTPNATSPFGSRFDGIAKGDCRRPEGGTCYDGVICVTGTSCVGADFVKKTEGVCRGAGQKPKKGKSVQKSLKKM